ncbi:MAG TPA: glycosyl transferase [Candidatus Omnitrophica bacterium]|nr:glycosyl transferase [Candidatus Omnitrophota bacterium]HBG62865.1 glycosyl transferase [Candidatus Omnitrophota bacterium]
MTVSIVIAVKGDNPYLRECIEACLKLDYPDFEILVLPDKAIVCSYPRTKIIPTGAVTPPQKRDIVLTQATGDVLAFLDDDAYPREDWLRRALKHFDQSEIAAVSGPAVTPETDSLLQKASGLVYSSYAMSGVHRYRYIPGRQRLVDDYPSCNFIIRTKTFKEIGGFATKFWPGEDTFLCLKIVEDLKKKIVYDPEVLVYHHRRGLFSGHLKQITQYALHRGYFVKRFPKTSLKPSYSLPSLLVSGLIVGGIASVWIEALRVVYFLTGGLYLSVVFLFSMCRDIRLTLLVFLGIIISHCMYGIYFIQGLCAKKMPEE